MLRTVSLIQFGFGGVGRAVASRILTAAAPFKRRYGLRLRYVALCDSRGAVVEPQGLSEDHLLHLLDHKREGRSLISARGGRARENLTEIIEQAGVDETVVIDVTATDETTAALKLALARGHAAVLANKKPLTGSMDDFRELTASGRLRYESTVGAGVPVIATLSETLLAANDAIQRIAGCFSGTLGFLTTGLQAGGAFSALVREAYEKGYTEPDPRDDLGGMDVARKALILARTLGWSLDLEQIEVESLYPAELASGSVDAFLDALSGLDDAYRERVVAALSRQHTLRYVAALEDGAARVGLQSVPLESPLGQLQGTDNLIAFHTAIYDPNPLVLQGRGAGVHGTAAGVLADVVRLSL
ncbi:MAG: homoserine dehydrogenase [Chloroflexi bacterium]|nr:homoserine dehydrogenase [Chloroflexota bacterium]